MTLLLTHQDVESVMDLDQAIEVIRGAIGAEVAGEAHGKAPTMLPLPNSALRVAMGAISVPSETLASAASGAPASEPEHQLRMGLRFSKAGRVNSSSAPPIAALFDEEGGGALAVLAYPFGPMRIAATMALAAQVLSPPEAATIGVIGSGRNASYGLEAVVRQLPARRVRVFSPHPLRRARFVDEMAGRLGIAVEGVDSARGAVQGADVVIVGTPSADPVVHGEWLADTALLLSYGNPGEVAVSAHQRASRVFVASKTHERAWADPWNPDSGAHPIHNEVSAGRLNWSDVVGLGEVFIDRAPGRIPSDGLVVFKESEGGYADIALVSHVYDVAKSRGLGVDFDFG